MNSPNRFDLRELVTLRKLAWNVRSRKLLPGLDARSGEWAAFHPTPRDFGA